MDKNESSGLFSRVLGGYSKKRIIKDYWGEKLQKCSAAHLHMFKLNDKTNEYLEKVGIPIIRNNKYHIFSYFTDFKYQKVKDRMFAVFAENYSGHIQIGISLHNNEIDMLFPDTTGLDEAYYYYNKDIQTYIYCFTEMLKCKTKYPLLHCDYESYETNKQQFLFAQELYQIIHTVDPKAVECGSRWTLTLMEFAENALDYEDILSLVESKKYESFEDAIMAFISGEEKLDHTII